MWAVREVRPLLTHSGTTLCLLWLHGLIVLFSFVVHTTRVSASVCVRACVCVCVVSVNAYIRVRSHS